MAAIPKPEDVTAYLAQYQLESVIEEAVNDAVLKQVKNPFQHIAELLMKHAEGADDAPGSKPKRVSISGSSQAAAASGGTTFKEQVEVLGEDKVNVKGEEIARDFVKSDTVALKPELEAMLKTFFSKMDIDGDGSVTKEEAVKFWGKNFAKVNANSMFNEVDEDGNGSVSWDEFTEFWKNVVGSGYSEEDLIEEVEMMLEGGSWVDFNDGRTT
uniref:EF-hand domain-containing protein n=1 Tax=Prymnesium polylepis TaxID=72548 RepID=A0A7S4JHQ4_9EUKA